jgi:hypothetical protein
MSQETPPYRFIRDDAGRLQIVRASDSKTISRNPEHPAFCAAKEWAAAQQPPIDLAEYVFPETHFLCRDKESFLEYCKTRGFRIVAYSDSEKWDISAEPVCDHYG